MALCIGFPSIFVAVRGKATVFISASLAYCLFRTARRSTGTSAQIGSISAPTYRTPMEMGTTVRIPLFRRLMCTISIRSPNLRTHLIAISTIIIILLSVFTIASRSRNQMLRIDTFLGKEVLSLYCAVIILPCRRSVGFRIYSASGAIIPVCIIRSTICGRGAQMSLVVDLFSIIMSQRRNNDIVMIFDLIICGRIGKPFTAIANVICLIAISRASSTLRLNVGHRTVIAFGRDC